MLVSCAGPIARRQNNCKEKREGERRKLKEGGRQANIYAMGKGRGAERTRVARRGDAKLERKNSTTEIIKSINTKNTKNTIH